MKLQILTPAKSLNSAYLKKSLTQVQIDLFKSELKKIFKQVDENQDEDYHKILISKFLDSVYCKDKYLVNVNKKQDLVIRLGNTPDENVGVILEFKKPQKGNIKNPEMVSVDKPNVKALQELVLYYLNETRKKDKHEIKHLIATDIYEWFIFDEVWFEKNIYRNSRLIKEYESWKVSGHDTKHFYDFIASKFINEIDEDSPCTYFNIKDFEKIITEAKEEDENKLIDLYKILSPEHLLKKPFINDSNTLNKDFYNELLHIIGLEETKDTGKKRIKRKEKAFRNEGTLLENSINILIIRNKLSAFEDIKQFGDNEAEQLFSLSLELCITWLNRILFLKLLEGQLIKYHKGDKAYAFLNINKIKNFNEVNELFFEVLAIPANKRTKSVVDKFGVLPYLNSSLFEESEIEAKSLVIADLKDRLEIPVSNNTVLKESDGKKITGNKNTLQYIFEFLDAYNFESDSTAKIQVQNKTIINASVLGLIFEKINGYKDGSFFTPGFITTYMCRQTIRLAVVQKFNEIKKWKIKVFDDLYNKINDINEANIIINDLKICDPAVGSGHFLVSALNEIIAIKSELQILKDKNGKRLKEYTIEVANDELKVTDEDGSIFVYKPQNKESQRIQETLFHEKQNIIENCLFGVDINPKSVMICRLRLWIELLKNMYYTQVSNYADLETLPNIDINIKCGNSLLNRFAFDSDLRKALKSIKYNIEEYRGFVADYKNEKSRDVKKGLQIIIDTFKSDFRTNIYRNDPKVIKLQKLQYEFNLLAAPDIFKEAEAVYGSKENKKKSKERLDKLETEINNLSKEIEELKNIYKYAFEWRFEFPEILNNNGEFEGFDVVIGNPPYIKEDTNRNAFNGLKTKECYQGKMDIWYLFGDLGLKLLKPNFYLCYIATNNWVTNAGASNFRNIVIKNSQIINIIDFGAYMIFENASIQTMIMILKNNPEIDNYKFNYRSLKGDKRIKEDVLSLLAGVEKENLYYLEPTIIKENLVGKTLTFHSDKNLQLLNKIKSKHNFIIRDKENKKLNIRTEFGNGIDIMQDFVNKASSEKMKGNAKIGDGVFVLSQTEFDNKKFSTKEKEIIKPYYTSKQLTKYYGNPNNTHWVIYTKSDINKSNKKTKKVPIDSFPKIKAHLDNYKSIITSAFGIYGLNRAREQYLFEGTKILVQRKCPKEPIFTYTEFDCYVSRAFLIIKSDRINLKYLTGLLNSKLITFWLRKKGKMQGSAYQLDKEPLLEIPIYKPTDKEANKIAELVDKIIVIKQQWGNTINLEKNIDDLVYELYDITQDEQKIIEGEN